MRHTTLGNGLLALTSAGSSSRFDVSCAYSDFYFKGDTEITKPKHTGKYYDYNPIRFFQSMRLAHIIQFEMSAHIKIQLEFISQSKNYM